LWRLLSALIAAEVVLVRAAWRGVAHADFGALAAPSAAIPAILLPTRGKSVHRRASSGTSRLSLRNVPGALPLQGAGNLRALSALRAVLGLSRTPTAELSGVLLADRMAGREVGTVHRNLGQRLRAARAPPVHDDLAVQHERLGVLIAGVGPVAGRHVRCFDGRVYRRGQLRLALRAFRVASGADVIHASEAGRFPAPFAVVELLPVTDAQDEAPARLAIQLRRSLGIRLPPLEVSNSGIVGFTLPSGNALLSLHRLRIGVKDLLDDS
jgi:hypothetical protein